MDITMRYCTLVIALALTLPLGCSNESPVAESSATSGPPQLLHLTEYGIPEGEGPLPPVAGNYPHVSRRAFAEKSNLAAGLYFRAVEEVEKASDWREANRLMRITLNEGYTYDLPRYVVEQAVAGVILRNGALLSSSEPLDSERLAAIEFYTSMMMENRSPDAATLERALSLLRSGWGESRWQEAALSVAEARQAYDLRRSQCEDCTGPEEGFSSLPPSMAGDYALAIQSYRERQSEIAHQLLSEARSITVTE